MKANDHLVMHNIGDDTRVHTHNYHGHKQQLEKEREASLFCVVYTSQPYIYTQLETILPPFRTHTRLLRALVSRAIEMEQYRGKRYGNKFNLNKEVVIGLNSVDSTFYAPLCLLRCFQTSDRIQF